MVNKKKAAIEGTVGRTMTMKFQILIENRKKVYAADKRKGNIKQ